MPISPLYLDKTSIHKIVQVSDNEIIITTNDGLIRISSRLTNWGINTVLTVEHVRNEE